MREPLSERKRVLAAGLSAEVREKLAPALVRAEFDVSLAPALRDAIEQVKLTRFDVALVGFPESAAELVELLAAIRGSESQGITACVLLFAAPPQLSEAKSYVGQGATEVLSTALTAVELQGVVLPALRSRTRLALRVMVRLSVQIGGEAAKLMCQTRDLSRTGLLAITDSSFPLGSPVRFTLDLPETADGIRGEAEVVRIAERSRDQVDGLGLRFLKFSADGELRLATFLGKRKA